MENKTLSKLQSEAVKEFEKKFPCSLHVEKFLLDQIQKAYSKAGEKHTITDFKYL